MRRIKIMRSVALAALVVTGACSKAPPPPRPAPNVGVVTVKLEPVTLTTELPGRITAVETSEVRPQVAGVIRRRLFTEGSLVHAGQVLYEIEDAPYRAALGSAEGQLGAAQSQINATRLLAQRYGQLVAVNAVSKQEADNAKASAQQASANVAAQRAAVDAARVNLNFTRIKAPISGRIGRSAFTAGALVQIAQADPLATIQRTDTVYVDVTQSAAQLLDLRSAMQSGDLKRDVGSARVQLLLPNGQTYPIEGRLEFSEVTVDQTTGAVTLRASFPNPNGTLLPGLYVRARLIEGVRQQVVLAPQQGISRDPRGRATALVVNAQNKVEQRNITTDRAIGDKWIVTSGLKAGDRLIVEGLVNLKPGATVKPGKPQQVGVDAPAPAATPGQGGK
ncbi:efflux RND transporter periplasmic adaptor subunit (plasmid) [Sphingomonas paeninsulae]|jgi:membrane fusion protein (multidrug efflux system)|uniref:Efflux RND transporter periplasmic adaptor subunit n=2 Tax=Sphingomonas paeninsulae TaxID=2319844 RepID=A0A494TDN3_SPHPE|nr:efflux RND transporter periplasmic adaptor subunit [Sphingomonas paeninsulae]AYJ85382.1 efflux RND transporter periplasmic adaptor subunit [Sphingomonas paeninsulae]